MGKGFELEFSFVEKWSKLANAEFFRIYVYALSNFKKSGKVLSVDEISKKLRINRETVEAAIEFWIIAEVIWEDGTGYSFSRPGDGESSRGAASNTTNLRVRPSYDAAEIDATAAVNEKIDYLFRQAEEILEKILSPSDCELLYSFVDWLGLPVEVVIMLLRFAASQGKTGKRYLETVAIDWADKGINTYESAEEHIKEIEMKLSNEGKVRAILGIYDRALTQTEKKYINMWAFEKNVPIPLIGEAYDRTVAATGKLSWAYMNKILLSWQEEGLETVEAVKESEALYKLKNAPVKARSNAKKSKFNNYVDTNNNDYSEFAQQILNDMLEE